MVNKTSKPNIFSLGFGWTIRSLQKKGNEEIGIVPKLISMNFLLKTSQVFSPILSVQFSHSVISDSL